MMTRSKYPKTPDGRYFVHKGRLWRCTNPALDETTRTRLVKELMAARRAVKAAKASGDLDEMSIARSQVDKAKVALGERGPTWWDDAPDFNQTMVNESVYADWWSTLDN